MSNLTHFNENLEAHMVDIGGKAPSVRSARASGIINMSRPALDAVIEGSAKKATCWALPASPPFRPPNKPAF